MQLTDKSNNRGAKLSDEQWDELCDHKRDMFHKDKHFSTRDAAEYVKKNFKINYSHVSLSQNKRWKAVVDELELVDADKRRRILKDNETYIVNLALSNSQILDKERKDLRKSLQSLKPGDRQYEAIVKRLKDVETELRQTITQYTALNEKLGVDHYIDDKLKDRESAEVQQAIEGLLHNLEKRVGRRTLADDLVDQIQFESGVFS